VILTQKVKQLLQDFQAAEIRCQRAKTPAAVLVSAGGGSRRPCVVPKNLQRSKGKLVAEHMFIPDIKSG